MANENTYEEKFWALAESLRDEATKFYGKGNGAAGGRLRKGLMQLKKLATELRQQIQEIKNKKSGTKKK